MGREEVGGNGSRLREPDEVLTNEVARGRECGRHAPPSNNRSPACAAFGRSGETGASGCEAEERDFRYDAVLNRKSYVATRRFGTPETLGATAPTTVTGGINES